MSRYLSVAMDNLPPFTRIFSPMEAKLRRKLYMRRYLVAYKVKWNVENKKRRLAYGVKSYWKHRQSRLVAWRAYYRRKKPHMIARQKEYYWKNRAKVRAYNSARCRKIKDTPTSEMDRIQLWLSEQLISTQRQCAYCKVSLPNKFDVDHIVPLSRGGKHELTNLCLACQQCNRSKGKKLISEWTQIA